jgi:hypothetical protein
VDHTSIGAKASIAPRNLYKFKTNELMLATVPISRPGWTLYLSRYAELLNAVDS